MLSFKQEADSQKWVWIQDFGTNIYDTTKLQINKGINNSTISCFLMGAPYKNFFQMIFYTTKAEQDDDVK